MQVNLKAKVKAQGAIGGGGGRPALPGAGKARAVALKHWARWLVEINKGDLHKAIWEYYRESTIGQC